MAKRLKRTKVTTTKKVRPVWAANRTCKPSGFWVEVDKDGSIKLSLPSFK